MSDVMLLSVNSVTSPPRGSRWTFTLFTVSLVRRSQLPPDHARLKVLSAEGLYPSLAIVIIRGLFYRLLVRVLHISVDYNVISAVLSKCVMDFV